MVSLFVPPRSLADFGRVFPDDEACRSALVSLRWPDGFVCPRCGGRSAWERRDRGLFLCRSCRAETSVLAGTVLHRTRLPLPTWFLAAYLVATTGGLNSLEIGRTLGIADQETAWLLLRRLRSVMSQGLADPLRGEVEADETYVGAPEPGSRGRPRSRSRKVTVLVLAEAGSARTRMKVVPDAKADTLLPVIAASVEPRATVTTDGLSSYLGLPTLGFTHRRLPHPPGGMKAGSFHSTPHADGAMSNFKRWVLATYHKPPANLGPYLDEFCFRAEFSGRRDEAFGALLGLMAQKAAA
jgi:transposase-like protein